MKLKGELRRIANGFVKGKELQERLTDFAERLVLKLKQAAKGGEFEYVYEIYPPFDQISELSGFLKIYFEDVQFEFVSCYRDDEIVSYKLKFSWS